MTEEPNQEGQGEPAPAPPEPPPPEPYTTEEIGKSLDGPSEERDD